MADNVILTLPKNREGYYGTIVADPPWSFRDKGSRISPDQKGNTRYTTMNVETIKSLDVATIAAPNAHLYLWTTSAHLRDAFDVMEAWGFGYKLTLVWVKVKKRWRAMRLADSYDAKGLVQIGMGHYYRHAHELVLFGVRGRCPALVRNLPTVFFAPRGEHSQKPEILQDYAEMLSPGPRLEMFARRRRKGWRAWGLEVPPKRRKRRKAA